MIIQAFTGMRMSELMSIKQNCIKEEEVTYNNKKYTIFKIEGLTFKYQKNIKNNENYGRLTTWLCPEIVVNAVKTLELATRIPRYKIEHKIKKLKELSIDTNNLSISKDLLFVSNHMPVINTILGIDKISTVDYSQKSYDSFIKKYNINLDFNLQSHCFRRTFARFLSRSLIDIEIEAIKEQFKHFSKDITIYYMREDKQLESNFSELMEEYDNLDINNENKKLLFEKIKKTIDNSILTANNLDELLSLTNGKQLKVVNEFVASINDETKTFSPIDCLTCEGNVIIPKIHLEYWLDMLSTYNELIEIEPNSIWYKKERDMVQSVVNTLKNNNFYITGVKK